MAVVVTESFPFPVLTGQVYFMVTLPADCSVIACPGHMHTPCTAQDIWLVLGAKFWKIMELTVLPST